MSESILAGVGLAVAVSLTNRASPAELINGQQQDLIEQGADSLNGEINKLHSCEKYI